MTTDLLIVNYSTRHMLERLLDTLHSDCEPDVWKIYLADNGSTDDSQSWIANNAQWYNFEEVIFNENIGYASAINDLAHRSDSEYLCAVNADTWFTTHHVQQVQDSMNEIPNCAVMGVKQMDEDNTIRHGGIFWEGGGNPVHRGWNTLDPRDELYKDKLPCWTVSGSIYYVRREHWEKMSSYEPYIGLYPMAKGAFLPTPLYFEETFCSQLAHHLGYEVWYDGTVETAGHTWNGSTGKSHSPQLQSLFQVSRDLYIKTCDALGIPHECKD